MRVLVAHAAYRQRGGEDASVAVEADSLRAHGHAVLQFAPSNDDFARKGHVAQLKNTLWNSGSAREVALSIERFAPDVVYVNNTFPAISPSILRSAAQYRVPVLYALRNYRLLCAKATLFRDGGPCADCVGRKIPLPAVQHRCYSDNLAASGIVAGLQALHRGLGTYESVARFAALSEAQRRVFIDAGLHPERVLVKPNFLSVDPDWSRQTPAVVRVLYVGRLTVEKGFAALLSAWKAADTTRMHLVVIGDGPLGVGTTDITNATWHKRLAPQEVAAEMREATVTVVPSLWDEPFGRVAIESLSAGTPVIAGARGGLPEIVLPHGGACFDPDNESSLIDLLHAVKRGRFSDPKTRELARHQYEGRFSPEVGYQALLNALESARAASV